MLCLCHEPSTPHLNFDYSYLGTDEHYADIRIALCKQCGTKWLWYLYENEAFSHSGRWYRGVLNKEIAPEDALTYLSRLEGYIYGGSYFGGKAAYGKGAILI